jgi:hypothetical protein
MKHTMRKLTAGLLALACVPVTTATARAEYYIPSTTWSKYEDREPVNTYGLIGDENDLIFVDEDYNSFTIVSPRMNHMQFVLREDVDIHTAADQLAEALDAYYPGLKEGLATDTLENYQYHIYQTNHVTLMQENLYPKSGSRKFDLRVNSSDLYYPLSEKVSPENADELEAQILLDLANRHLISEFYGWGETAFHTEGFIGVSDESGDVVLTDYQGFRRVISENENGKEFEIIVEPEWKPEEVQEYLTSHYPGLVFEPFRTVYEGIADAEGKTTETPCTYYHIVSEEKVTNRQRLEIAGELYKQYGLRPGVMFMEQVAAGASRVSDITGHNALERPGDTNLDCEVDIMDVIAANKHLLGVSPLDKTGMKNADTNGDGAVDSADTLDILKTVLEISG